MGPPQVPPAVVISAIRSLVAGDGPALLLGVTPAYAALGNPLTAVDGNPDMIAALWSGDTDRARAICADWTMLPFADKGFVKILGDGSLNSLPSRRVLDGVLKECARLLAPGGTMVMRLFTRPEPAPEIDDLLERAACDGVADLNVLRWQVAGALACGADHAVPVSQILSRTEAALGPLADYAAKWHLPVVTAGFFENYRGSDTFYLFPTRSAFAEWAAGVGFRTRFVEVGGYPGAELCPLAVMTR